MSDAPATTPWLLPTVSLWHREMTRFVRQRSRIVGALGTPIVFWLLIGSGLRDSFRMPGTDGGLNYLQYAFPGTIVLILLFTAIFSTISIIEDRREGFLQSVLASPAPRSAIVMGKVFGSASLAVIQAVLFLLLAPTIGVSFSVASFLAVLAALIVLSIGLSALGVLIAWPMDSTQGFHAVMNLFLMPMWLLSGAFFPASGASSWLSWIMAVNPLTYGVATVRHALYWGSDQTLASDPSLAVSISVTIGATLVVIALATWCVSRR